MSENVKPISPLCKFLVFKNLSTSSFLFELAIMSLNVSILEMVNLLTNLRVKGELSGWVARAITFESWEMFEGKWL